MNARPRAWRLSLVAAGLVTACLMAVASPKASAEPLAEGDTPPDFVGKEFINTPEIDMKALKGKVILYEIFRTW